MMSRLLWLFIILACGTANAQQPPREPGLAVRIYDIGHDMSRLHTLVPGQTPNVNKIVPVLDLRSGRGDFGPLEDYFITIVTGFLRIDVAGDYQFRLISDDGSKLFINNELIIDHDGLHGSTPKDGSVHLAEGDHAIEVQHFDNTVTATLVWQWKPPGQAEFKTVPSEVLSCPKGEVKVTSPGPKQIIRPLQRGKPGDGQPLNAVHPSYDLSQARPDWFKPRVGGLDWLSDGRMVLCTWDADGAVYLLNHFAAGDSNAIEVKKIAAGLAEPLGLTVVDDRIFVLQKQELTELIDLNGDDVIDEYRCVSSGWNVTANFHEFAFGLVHKDQHFYAALAIAIDPGGRSTRPQIAERGTVIRIDRDGNYEVFADGLRTPNGIGLGIEDEIFVTDNQGDWVPVSKLVHVKKNSFFGSQAVRGDASANWPVQRPVVWLPQGEIGNSPGEPAIMKDGPYAGQMIHAEVTHGGVKRVFIEKVSNEYQGCVFRFTQGLEAGVNRITWGPDGALYCGGIGSTGNWGQDGKLRYGLQRLKYNGKQTFEMLAVRAKTNGMDIEFTQPLPTTAGWDAERYSIETYRYEPTAEYGGEKLDRTPLRVRSASVSSDRRSVFLAIDDLKPDHVVYIRLLGPWQSESGQPIWSTEAWYTLNAIPQDRMGTVLASPHRDAHNALTADEQQNGWKLLFDGQTLDGWRGMQQTDISKGWEVIDGCIVRTGAGGDLIHNELLGDFELTLDWKISPAGNSGIFYRASEDHGAVWATGLEMQVLDNERHPDGENPATSAGALYGLYAPSWDATYPAGTFNTARIIARGNHVEHWLNGNLQCTFEIDSDDWKQRIAASKFKDLPHFGTLAQGHIVLQDHGDRVWYRNIKVRHLSSE